MSSRPAVRRTYGKPRLHPTSSSSSLLFDSPSAMPSSPPSFRLDTPPTSPRAKHASSPARVPGSDDDVHRPSISPPAPAGPSKRAQPVQSSLEGFFAAAGKKRPLGERTTIPPPLDPRAEDSAAPKKRPMQMHLTHLPLLHSCRECSMSYVRGGEDEHLHAKHHAKVTRGIPWDGLGKGKGKGRANGRGEEHTGWRVVQEHVEFGSGRERGTGRIIMCDGSYGGSKLDDILAMVDTVLSSPALSLPILERCKIFLLVTSSPPPTRKRPKPTPGGKPKQPVERIVGVVVAQPIKVALRVLREGECGMSPIDSGGGVMCDPEALDTPLGIHRLFTIPSYRSLGLARVLLDASARHTVYGCKFDPTKGQVAFSQPTESGRRTMEKWGGGQVRVFIDDERQL